MQQNVSNQLHVLAALPPEEKTRCIGGWMNSNLIASEDDTVTINETREEQLK
jgi:hypothetical protein